MTQCQDCVEGFPDLESNVVECNRCDCTGLIFTDDNFTFRRGFVEEITCSWADWGGQSGWYLCEKCGRSIALEPTATRKCSACNSDYVRKFRGHAAEIIAAQPIRKVKLTTSPEDDEAIRLGAWVLARNDMPLLWAFETWPGIEFDLPDQIRTRSPRPARPGSPRPA